MAKYDSAIDLLTSQRAQLTDGLDSIAEQENRIDRLRKELDSATERLAASKTELLEIDSALGVLKAGS